MRTQRLSSCAKIPIKNKSLFHSCQPHTHSKGPREDKSGDGVQRSMKYDTLENTKNSVSFPNSVTHYFSRVILTKWFSI